MNKLKPKYNLSNPNDVQDLMDLLNKLKPKYNLSNPNDVQDLMDLLQAGDFSDIEVGAGDSEEEDELVMNQEYRRVGRGPDTVSTMEFGPDDNQEHEESNDDNNDSINEY
ncbi:hypothetical protein QE152_g9515 [Popillia japonica]|uniref:Uncharacterized protein n=1 Tax=Popillia japonica TaxID=7064 RepID=A0AAW1LYT6_POPJA